MPDSPLVYVLILNWNSFADTAACVQSVEKTDYKNYKIVIIDNYSTDHSWEMLRGQFPAHFFIQTGANAGYAGGNNAGMKYAVHEGADYVWILNPDVRVEPGSLKTMIESMEKEASLGICGPVITEYEENGSSREIFGWRVLPETGWEGERNNELGPDTRVDYVYGCSMLVKKKVLLDTGLFREEFFMYSEEKEFCLRARKRNWELKIIEEAHNRHYHSHNPRAYYYCCRNSIFISRIERQRLFKTLSHHLNTRSFLQPLLKGQVKKSLFHFKQMVKRKIPAIVSGIFTPIKAPPAISLRDESRP